MRAMVLAATGDAETDRLEAREIPEPTPGAGEIAIAVEACGVCRTDLHIVEGEVSAEIPLVPGHQVAGRVSKVGSGAAGLREGDAVGVGWLWRTCGVCRFCTTERENLCLSPLHTGRDRAGGYAESMIADARFAFPLPPGLAPEAAAPLLCAGIIGYRSLAVSGIRPGGRLGLVGFGASAHLAIQAALHGKCEVYVFTREERHRRLSREMGAAWAGAVGDDPGVPLDAAITFAPAGELLPQMLPRLDRGGTLAVNAIHMSPIPSFSFDDLYWERGVRSVASYTRRDAREFLALAAEVPIRARVETFALEQANAALGKIKRGEIEGAAVLRLR
ncbi:MAG TPA: zinc-dependent alcohol dehydrogenase family protein [Thermoanaerobaculia bacterium]|nr:zinc-dependent alcohol dehydrogenase family protein [Thermoanaerobaculia bacterium]